MTTHYDEEAQVEQLRRWWRENRLPLLTGLLLGMGVIVGWQTWEQRLELRAAAGSHLYEDLGRAGVDKYADGQAMADRLVKDYGNTPYAAMGALRMAALAIEANKPDEARARLEWVVNTAAHPSAGVRLLQALHLLPDTGAVDLLPLAQLRLAQVLWQQGKLDDALHQLQGDPGAYGGLYDELRGDIKLAQGDRAAARAAYENALREAAADAPNRDALQRKIDDLADAAAVHS
ncbi:MAG: tetratricopeptide repeat protein [Nevskia sp.]|nr:tetratricopeptide repeat protein [Nevskia sp.]